METVGRLIGFGLIGVDRRPWRSFWPIRHLRLISKATGLAGLVAVALTGQGCCNASSQTTVPVYPGPAEYAAYGYPDDLYATSDPFFDGYYWWLPYYYYAYYAPPGGCYGGWCGPHGGGKSPHLPWRVGSLPERLPPRESTGVTQRSIVSVQSPANSNLSADYHAAGVTSNASSGAFHGSGFGGGGFHSGGFGGGGFSGSAHR